MSDDQSSHVQHLGPVPPQRPVGALLGIGIFLFPLIFVWFLLRAGYSTMARVIGFAWTALTLVSFFALAGSSTGADQSAAAPQEAAGAESAEPEAAAIQVTSRELAKAFNGNEVAAQKKYGAGVLEVTGVVEGISLDFMDNPVLQLDGLNQFQQPQASFSKDYADKIEKMSKGDKVTIRCDKVTEVMSVPQLSGCTM